jgi:hypothetical protein
MDLTARYYWNDQSQIEGLTCRFLICADEIRVADSYRALVSGEESADTVGAFQAVLTRDSVSAYRWADLGEAFLSSGKREEARKCLVRAIELAPYSPTILLRAATFYFRTGENNAALPHTSRILALTDAYDAIIFSYYSRLGIPASDILQHGLPESERAAREYFRFRLRSKLTGDVASVWQFLLARRITDTVIADEYVRALLAQNEFRQARQVWLYHHSSTNTDAGNAGDIFNAGFERQPAKSVLDWSIEPLEGVNVNRDNEVRHSGAWSLHVRFTGSGNVHFRNVSQMLALDPGSYRLSAHVRTQGITTDKGVGLRVVQHDSADTVYARTPAVVGTSEWANVEATFSVSGSHGPLRLEISREPSLRIDNRIKGDAWIDSVRIEKLK